LLKQGNVTKKKNLKTALVACCSVFSSLALADESQNYFSLKYGLARSNIAFNHDAKFKDDNGTSKVVEFFWGNSSFAKWIGGVNLTPKNKYAGYLLGVVIDDHDIISVKQFHTEDELLKNETDFGYSRGLSFGQVKASTTEYSWIFSHSGANFFGVTYGTSNYPATVTVSKDPTAEDEKWFFDPRPEFQYLHVGFEMDPVRAALLSGKEVRDYAWDWLYLQSKIGFGFYHFKLSDTQYSTTYANQNDTYALKNESGIEPFMALNLELGLHGTLAGPVGSLVGAVGYYYQLPPEAGFTKLFKVNETANGYYFSADGSPHHGISGRLAVTF